MTTQYCSTPSLPSHLTANLLYKAALREVVAIQDTDGPPPEGEEHSATVPFNPNMPHPYQLALGVLCIQKVLFPQLLAGFVLQEQPLCLLSFCPAFHNQ